MTTPNLQLPEPPDFASPIAAEERDGQRALDALGPGWIAVLSASTATPPASPAQGDRYLVPTGATGAWATHARHIAYFTPIGWGYRAPRRGWVALALDEGAEGFAYVYQGTDWTRMPALALDFSTVSALDIPFDGYGLPGDPLTVDAALDKLFALVAAGGGGGGGGGDVTKISSVVLGSPAATVSFNGIPATYGNLSLWFSTNSATQFDALFMQFNGDTAANYDSAVAYNGSAGGGSAVLNAAMPEIASMPGSAFNANQRQTGQIMIPDYAGTGYKMSQVQNARRDGVQLYVTSYTHNWHNTNGITDILLGFASGNNFVAGSRFDLYGYA